MIFNNSQIYGKVWNVTKPEGKNYIELRMSTREKKQDETSVYSSWFPRVIGHAFNTLKDVKTGDRILITKSKFTNEPYTDQNGNTKSAFRFLILEATIENDTNPENGTTQADETSGNNASDDNCPW